MNVDISAKSIRFQPAHFLNLNFRETFGCSCGCCSDSERITFVQIRVISGKMHYIYMYIYIYIYIYIYYNYVIIKHHYYNQHPYTVENNMYISNIICLFYV